jgi:UDP-N-acetylglucosamine 2-epimerase (non-hydrolysing)
MTLHRPSNVDEPSQLENLLTTVAELSSELRVLFPMHPRTSTRLTMNPVLSAQLAARSKFILAPPLSYLDCLCASAQARMILTDSGGLQEESTALGVPCLTLRENTERPITVELGTSTLLGRDEQLLRKAFRSVLNGTYKTGSCPELWDGHAAERIAAQIASSVGAQHESFSVQAHAA